MKTHISSPDPSQYAAVVLSQEFAWLSMDEFAAQGMMG
jgi:hypothetical protein